MRASSEMQKNVKLVTPAHNNFLRKWGHTYDLSILVANTQLLTFFSLLCSLAASGISSKPHH
jgi:hypothetical protein